MTDLRTFDRAKAAMEPLDTAFSAQAIGRLLTALCAPLPLEPDVRARFVDILVRVFTCKEAEHEERWACIGTQWDHLDAVETQLKAQGADHKQLRCPAQDLKTCAMWWNDYEYQRVSKTYCPHCGTRRDPTAPRRPVPRSAEGFGLEVID